MDDLTPLYKAATAFKEIVTGLGILIGGIWAYFRFRIGRNKETALDIDFSYTTHAYASDRWITFIEVHLKNKGQVQLRARETEPAYDHNYGPGHRHQYGLGMKIRKIPPDLHVNHWVDWFSTDLKWVETLPEVNLLKGYIKAAGDGVQTDFWMEPGESYSLAAPLVLAAGSYLALVTFVGASQKIDELWQRIFLITVPATDAHEQGAVTSPRALQWFRKWVR